MQLTAAVINAGLGDLTLGLQMSGFQVIAAFEPEEKAAVIHKLNLDVPLHQLSLEEIDPSAMPHVDLLAAHLYHPSHSRVNLAKMNDISILIDMFHGNTSCNKITFILLFLYLCQCCLYRILQPFFILFIISLEFQNKSLITLILWF